MKKLIWTAFFLTAFITLSCKKCQTCTTTVTQDYGSGTPQTSTSSEDYCGKEYDDAPAEGTTSQSSGGISQSVVVQCQDK